MARVLPDQTDVVALGNPHIPPQDELVAVDGQGRVIPTLNRADNAVLNLRTRSPLSSSFTAKGWRTDAPTACRSATIGSSSPSRNQCWGIAPWPVSSWKAEPPLTKGSAASSNYPLGHAVDPPARETVRAFAPGAGVMADGRGRVRSSATACRCETGRKHRAGRRRR